jgi:CDP-diacylglycerol--glycerol-3-phosphate 3-phosphatidyltransferase
VRGPIENRTLKIENTSWVRWIPNALTVLRVILTLVFLAMIIYAPQLGDGRPVAFLTAALALFVVAGVTDILDGPIARHYGVTSKFGRVVDPLADKVLVCGAFLCFAWIGQPALSNLVAAPHNWGPAFGDAVRWGTAAILILREVGVTVRRHMAESRGVAFGAVLYGKLKMFVQSFAIGTIMVGWAFVSREWGDWFIVVTYALMIALTIFSGIQSIFRPIQPGQK